MLFLVDVCLIFYIEFARFVTCYIACDPPSVHILSFSLLSRVPLMVPEMMTVIMVMLMCGENRVEFLCGEHVFFHPINGDGGEGGVTGRGSKLRVCVWKLLRTIWNEINWVQRSHAVGLKYCRGSFANYLYVVPDRKRAWPSVRLVS